MKLTHRCIAKSLGQALLAAICAGGLALPAQAKPYVRNAHSVNCLDAWDGPAVGRQVVASSCWDGPNQKFAATKIISAGDRMVERYEVSIGEYCLRPVNSRRGSVTVLAFCRDGGSAHWMKPSRDFGRFVWMGDGENKGQCLDMSLSQGSIGRRPVILWDCKAETEWGERNQDWLENN